MVQNTNTIRFPVERRLAPRLTSLMSLEGAGERLQERRRGFTQMAEERKREETALLLKLEA